MVIKRGSSGKRQYILPVCNMTCPNLFSFGGILYPNFGKFGGVAHPP